MSKTLAYPLTLIYLIAFGLTLVVFHPIQWVCLNVFGYDAHKKSVSIMNWVIMRCTNILGTRYTLTFPENMPPQGPVIIVTNHQSLYDIPPIIWHLRKYHPKFVSKKELGRGIPSVSYNLRHGGSVLIDRKDRRQAADELTKLGAYIQETRRSAVIFPEGTRSRNGEPKPFRTLGLITLLKNAPDAWILPITINNSWKMFRYGKFPNGIGTHIRFTIHSPVKWNPNNKEQLNEVEQQIVTHLDPEK
jgi:1-acyl-sn-glycerol-3-phosphate acyltransferase